jgi:Domain of unknown function (DUF4340)
MALQKNTLALLVLALLLGGGVLIYERVRGSAPSTPGTATADTKPLFNFKEDDVQAFTITLAGQPLSFERNSQPSPLWQMKAPKVGPANDASVAFLLNLLATGTSENRLEVEANKLQQFGLAPAQITVVVTLKNREQHRLAIGSPTFNQSGVYGLVDAPTASTPKVQVQVLPLNFLNAVSRPLSEWEPAPAAPTPSPSLLTPPPGGSETPPAPEPTPSPAVPDPAATSPTSSPTPSLLPSPSPSPLPTTTPTQPPTQP